MSFITKKIRRNESCINNRPFPVVNRTQPVGTPSILVHGEKDVKDNKSNDDTKQVATADDKNKKVIDKSIPQRNMKEIFQKIVPFIKIYSPNSFKGTPV
jgi:hypothetical protein